MTKLMACRMCLALDTRLYILTDTPLQEAYEKITNLSLQTMDGRSVMACHICHHLLKKCHQFMEKSVRADQLLRQILNSGLQLTENSISLIDKSQVSSMLAVTPTEIMSFVSEVATVEVPVKDECKVKTEIEIEMKEAEDGVLSAEEPEPIQQDESHSSQSEDDIPLHKIRLEKKGVRLDKRRVRKKEGLKAVALEIILTKEEQLQQMMERSKSLNYLNSPYKCNLCYKGFVETKAFENHKEKHDESSGQFECDICRMRYATARHLRTHALTSHARQFACGKCPHRSHTANQAREHEKWHNGYTYECQLCSQKFRKPTSYLTHMRKRHPTSHVCRACGESFVGRHGLLMHTSKAHRREGEKSTDSQTFCSECNIQFASLEAWKRHILSSIKHALGGESSNTCLACGVVVPAGTSLREHLRSHAPADKSARPPRDRAAMAQLPCEQCGANFVNRSKLQAHIKRIHLGLKYNKNIVCEVCGKKCTSNASLKYHQRTHTGERPYACTQCPKRFADNNQLRIHVRTHTGERPYCCAVCGKSFSQKPALNRHYRVHTGAKPYDCQFCPKTFSQSNSLKLHVNTVHLKLPHAKRKPVAEQQDL